MDYTLISKDILNSNLWSMSLEARLVWMSLVTMSEGDMEFSMSELELAECSNMSTYTTGWAVDQLIRSGYLGRSVDGIWLTEESLKYVRAPTQS